MHYWVTGVCPELYFGVQSKNEYGEMKKKQIHETYEGTYQCPVFCSKITSRTLLSCKSVNIYFLPLTFHLEIWVKVTKNRRIFFPPTKGVPIIIESSTDKNNRKKVRALQVCNIRIAKKYMTAFELILTSPCLVETSSLQTPTIGLTRFFLTNIQTEI